MQSKGLLRNNWTNRSLTVAAQNAIPSRAKTEAPQEAANAK